MSFMIRRLAVRDRDSDSDSDRQTDRQTGRQTDRQTDRHLYDVGVREVCRFCAAFLGWSRKAMEFVIVVQQQNNSHRQPRILGPRSKHKNQTNLARESSTLSWEWRARRRGHRR